MGRRRDNDTYTGRSGQLAVMAELLLRGCNAAVPRGQRRNCVFAFRDDTESVARIQVKTGQGSPYANGDGYVVQFGIPKKDIDRVDNPPLYYALAVWLEGHYVDYFIIGRTKIRDYWNGPEVFGSETVRDRVLYLQCREQVMCREVDLSRSRNTWSSLPPLAPLPALTPAAEPGKKAERKTKHPRRGCPRRGWCGLWVGGVRGVGVGW